ncbi:helix-turn-helix transcriptional regulator [Desulfosarcina ovata]|uniref:HTH luxR-type domain-containing protein n=2 Tax=Desulfosarcina ovata TaxID=83564 RepID=A0A5K8A9G0_9BACT|nr:helix-turn-helix transcriptional regulator [Desulfosarcina ovata]BBO81425.1 hypothetical protein DSCO28_19910 [Desulfosarcina ovata subsp. sediminis]BBO88680.1 hypothetical protein DSCOOX_18600 [Desulfosarcina ovata subsp. ovata]
MTSNALENRDAMEIRLKNISDALDALIEQNNKEKIDICEKILSDFKKSIFPFVDKMKTEQMSSAARTYLAIIESKLEEISYSNPYHMLGLEQNFTTTEIHIIELIKQGKRSKEIAGLLNVSIATISFHRNNIRKKLGIKNKKQNLFSFLNSLVI